MIRAILLSAVSLVPHQGRFAMAADGRVSLNAPAVLAALSTSVESAVCTQNYKFMDINPQPPVIKGERERKIRSLSKALSHRVIGFMNTFLVAWIFTQNINLSLKVMAVREGIAIVIYLFHERIWNNVRWGRYRLEKVGLPPKDPNRH